MKHYVYEVHDFDLMKSGSHGVDAERIVYGMFKTENPHLDFRGRKIHAERDMLKASTIYAIEKLPKDILFRRFDFGWEPEWKRIKRLRFKKFK
jgi:hypothetical protein